MRELVVQLGGDRTIAEDCVNEIRLADSQHWHALSMFDFAMIAHGGSRWSSKTAIVTFSHTLIPSNGRLKSDLNFCIKCVYAKFLLKSTQNTICNNSKIISGSRFSLDEKNRW